jgi:hypothetical protein
MATFYLTTGSDSSYDKIMEYLISRSLTFSKDTSSGPVKLEIMGNTNDYIYFKEQIEAGMIFAHLQEAL